MSYLRLGDYLERPAIIQQERNRYQLFTITPIGGPAEIVKWREQQAKKLAEYGIKREELKAKKKEFIAGGRDAPVGELNWDGRVILSESKDWDAKLSEAKARRRELRRKQILTDTKAWEVPLPEPEPPSMWERFKTWIAGK